MPRQTPTHCNKEMIICEDRLEECSAGAHSDFRTETHAVCPCGYWTNLDRAYCSGWSYKQPLMR